FPPFYLSNNRLFPSDVRSRSIWSNIRIAAHPGIVESQGQADQLLLARFRQPPLGGPVAVGKVLGSGVVNLVPVVVVTVWSQHPECRPPDLGGGMFAAGAFFSCIQPM